MQRVLGEAREVMGEEFFENEALSQGMLDQVTVELQSLGSSCLCAALGRQRARGSEPHMFRLQCGRW